MIAAEALPEPLPPPPRTSRRARRLARGSMPPIVAELAIDVRPIAPPSVWTRVVPVSALTGVPLLARDRRPPEPIGDRAAGLVVGLLGFATVILGALLV